MNKIMQMEARKLESLSQVLKNMADSTLLNKIEEKTRELQQDPLIQKWRDKYPFVTDEELRLHMNKLYQYRAEYRNCSNCPGLERCPNDFTGHYTVLSAELLNGQAHIYDRKTACRKHLTNQSQEAVRKRVKSFYIDNKALSEAYSIADIISVDRERAIAVEHIIDYIDKAKRNELQPKGLYLVGQFGTGKTFLMCYMLHELAKFGYTGVIVYMPDFLEDLKSMISEQGKLKETIELLKETDLLIFDDIGAEHLNPWARDHVLATILNYRMNRKPTFFTSNYDLDALEQHFSFTNKDGEEQLKGKRLMDRIAPFVDVIVVNGENKRGKL